MWGFLVFRSGLFFKDFVIWSSTIQRPLAVNQAPCRCKYSVCWCSMEPYWRPWLCWHDMALWSTLFDVASGSPALGILTYMVTDICLMYSPQPQPSLRYSKNIRQHTPWAALSTLYGHWYLSYVLPPTPTKSDVFQYKAKHTLGSTEHTIWSLISVLYVPVPQVWGIPIYTLI